MPSAPTNSRKMDSFILMFANFPRNLWHAIAPVRLALHHSSPPSRKNQPQMNTNPKHEATKFTKDHEETRFDRGRHRARETLFATEPQRHRDVHRGRTECNQARHHHLLPIPNSQYPIFIYHFPIFPLSLPPRLCEYLCVAVTLWQKTPRIRRPLRSRTLSSCLRFVFIRVHLWPFIRRA